MAVPKDLLVELGILVLKFFDSVYQFGLGAVYAVDDIYNIQLVLMGDKDAGGIDGIAFEHVLFENSISPLAEDGSSF